MFSELVSTLQKSTLLCIATDITLPTESIRTQSIQDWKQMDVNLQKRPTIFIIG